MMAAIVGRNVSNELILEHLWCCIDRTSMGNGFFLLVKCRFVIYKVFFRVALMES